MPTKGEPSAAASSAPADDVAAAVAAASSIAAAAGPGSQSQTHSTREQSAQPPAAADDDDDDDGGGTGNNDRETVDPDPDDTQPQPPPFEPLFALVTNATTGSTVHPRVQYIFSDDDPSVLADPPVSVAAAAGPDGRPHRAVLVDLVPSPDNSRWSVSWAASLSPDFAVTDSRVAEPQQTDGEEPSSLSASVPGGAGGGVLRVEGVEREPVDPRPEASPPASASGSGIVGREDVETLADEFRRRMGVLRKVVGEAGRRTEAIDRLRGEIGQQRNEQSAEEPASRAAGQAGVAQSTEASREAS